MTAQMQEILAKDVPSLALYYRDGDWAYRPADYNGWVPDQGQGIFTKRSFLPEYVKASSVGGTQQAGSGSGGPADSENGGSSLPLVLGLLALAGVAGAVLLARRRRTVGDEDD